MPSSESLEGICRRKVGNQVRHSQNWSGHYVWLLILHVRHILVRLFWTENAILNAKSGHAQMVQNCSAKNNQPSKRTQIILLVIFTQFPQSYATRVDIKRRMQYCARTSRGEFMGANHMTNDSPGFFGWVTWPAYQMWPCTGNIS